MDSVTVAHDYDDLRHLVDRLTGPLVVAIDRSDKQHARCAAWLESPNAAFPTSLATGEPQRVAITCGDRFPAAETY